MNNQKNQSSNFSQSDTLMLALEPRILFDAAGLVTAIDQTDLTQDDQIIEVPSSVAEDTNSDSDDSNNQLLEAVNLLSSPSQELVFVDASVENYQLLINDIQTSSSTANFQFIVINPDENGLEKISETLREQEPNSISAIHIISHATEGELELGNTEFNNNDLEPNSQIAQSISQWQTALSEQADILLYGCRVAGDHTGIEFVQQLSELTGADVAASTDNTGSANLGGDWDLEYQTGAVETSVLSSDADVLLAPTPLATVTSDTPMLNEGFELTVTFKNTGADGETGYGPFFDMVVGSGLDMDLTPNYFGSPMDSNLVHEMGTWDGSKWVDSSGDEVTEHLYTGFNLPAANDLGDRWVLIQLPFGSFVNTQPDAELTFSGTARGQNYDGQGSDHWDGVEGQFPVMVPDNTTQPNGSIPNVAIPVSVRGGFRFGADALDNPDTDTPIVAAIDTGTVTPNLITVEKIVTENFEGVTGKNFTSSVDITIDIATGVTVKGIDIIDQLPNDVIYQDNLTVNIAGSATTEPSTTAPHNPTDNELIYGIDPNLEITGGSGVDITMSFDYYVPEYDADAYGGDETLDVNPNTIASSQGAHNSVIDPLTGNDTSSTNTASGTVDLVTTIPGYTGPNTDLGDTGATDTLEQKSIALNKEVSTISGTGGSGSVLEYTLSFAVSDYFAFDNTIITDVFSDGQRFDESFNPTLEIESGHPDLNTAVSANSHNFVGYTTGTQPIDAVDADVTAGTFNFSGTNFSGTLNAAPDGGGRPTAGTAGFDGSTTLRFNVSDELDIFDGDNDGIFKGASNEITGVEYSGGTIATITYRTVIQEEFSDFHLTATATGDPSVDTSDTLINNATITGELMDPHDDYKSLETTITGSETANTVVEIPALAEMSKEIYAINGDTNLPSTPRFNAGDTVTYRITTGFLNADTESFKVVDYLPLPVFNMNTLPVTGPIQDYTGDPNDTPVAGTISYGPAHTLYGSNRDDAIPEETADNDPYGYGTLPVYSQEPINPTVSVDTDSNQLIVEFGQFDTEPSASAVVDLLFTVESTDDPFAQDGFFLTNQAEGFHGNTVSTVNSTSEIVQILMVKPDLKVTKGAVRTSNTAGILVTEAPDGNPNIEYASAGSSDEGFNGIINSEMLATSDEAGANTDIQNLDAGDIVRFSIAIENTGGGNAFDIQIKDTIPTGFEMPTSGYNLSAALGSDSATPITLVDSTGKDITVDGDPADLFNQYLEIADDPDGILEAGYSSGDGSTLQNDGTNIVIITYDLQIAQNVAPAETISNNAEVINFSHNEGGDDHTDDFPSDNFTDDANITISHPFISKALTDSSESSTTNPNFAIGEVATYQLTVTVPEGTMPNLSITDNIPVGMAYVANSTVFVQNGFIGTVNGIADASVTVANGWTVTNSGGDGEDITFAAIGDVIPTGTTDSNDTSFILQYEVVVLDVDSNDDGDTLTNTATLSYPDPNPDTPATAESTDSVDINIVEPDLSITKDINITAGDAGDPLTITLTVQNTGHSDAFDVVITDLLDPNKYTNINVSNQHGFTADFGTTTANTITFQGGTIADGAELTFTFTADLATGVNAGEVLTNTANITESSTLPGVDAANERDETTEGNSNHSYTGNDDDTLTINSPNFTKTLIGTGHDTPNNSNTQAVVGETIQYRLVIDVPEGTMPNTTIFDRLDTGLALVSIDNITPSSGDVTTDAAGGFAGVTSNVSVTNSARNINLDFGTLTNTNTDNSTVETITVEYTVVVVNNGSANAGWNRNNRARLDWDTTPNLNYNIQKRAPTVRILEPSLTVDKIVDNNTPDSGDILAYTLTVTHNGTGNNEVEAYDVTLEDIIPTGLSYILGSLAYTGGVNPDLNTLQESGGTISAEWSILNPGDTSTLTFQVIVDAGAVSGNSITNTSDIEWTSLPGTPTGLDTYSTLGVERTGDSTDTGGTENDYNATESEVITVPDPKPGKEIIDTSEAHTLENTSINGMVNLAIGEIARYRVIIEMPEALMPDLQLVDILPAGMTFLNDGTATIRFNTNTRPTFTNGQLDNDYGVGLNTSNFTLDNSLIAISGNNVTFSFGDVTNNDSNNLLDGNAEDLIIEYNAIVANQTGVDRADILTNSAQVYQSGGPVNTPVTIDATVVEPNLSLSINDGGVTNADAGDIITYTIHVSSDNDANATTAFEVNITDSFPAELEIQSVSYSGLPAYLTEGSTITASTSAMTGQDLSITANELQENDSFDIVVTAKVRDTGVDIIQATQTVDNTANLTYTSLPGATGTTLTNSVGTDSNAGTAGNADGERTGSGIAPNDYTGTANDDFNVPDPIITKVLATPATTDYTIGDEFEYVITLTVPEGRTGDTLAQVTDIVDAGLSYVSGSLSVIPGAGITVGLDDSNPSFFTRNDSGDTNNETLTFDFDYIDYQNGNAAHGLNTGTIEIRYTVRVDNIAINQDGQTRNNTASFTYTDPAGVVNLNITDSISNDTLVTIVEPSLSITKVQSTTGSDAGDAVEYTLTITNASGTTVSTAYDINLTDTLDARLTNINVSSNGAIIDTNSGAGNTIDITLDELAPGATATVTIQADINQTASPSEIIENTIANITYTSKDGADSNERTGSGGVNDYANSDGPVSFTLDAVTISKSMTATSETETSGNNVAIGEMVTYSLQITVPEGTLPGITLNDAIPTGMQLVANSIVLDSSSFTGTINNQTGTVLNNGDIITTFTGGNTDGEDIIINLGEIVPTASVGTANNVFNITYQTIVSNVVTNINAQTLTNSADLSYSDPEGGVDITATTPTDPTMVVIEPDLEVVQTVLTSTTGVDAGDLVQYQIVIQHTGSSTADAFDIDLSDSLPIGLNTLSLVSATHSGAADDVSGNFTIVGNTLNNTTGVGW